MSRPPDRAADAALSDADRDALSTALARHHAAGSLTVEQLEERLADLYRAQTRTQAAQVISGLAPLAPEGGARRSWLRNRKRHGDAAAPAAGAIPTAERFRDPTSGRVMRVWVDPVSGARQYVPDEGTA